jgi:hypothetical protein
MGSSKDAPPLGYLEFSRLARVPDPKTKRLGPAVAAP